MYVGKDKKNPVTCPRLCTQREGVTKDNLEVLLFSFVCLFVCFTSKGPASVSLKKPHGAALLQNSRRSFKDPVVCRLKSKLEALEV